MTTSRLTITALAAVLGLVSTVALVAQTNDPKPGSEVLMRTPAQTPPMMPYVAVHDPVFVAASEASFAMDDDLVIGVAQGKIAKAYMALDLTQHGSVDDQMPDAPIEVTWCGTCGTGAVFRAELNGPLFRGWPERIAAKSSWCSMSYMLGFGPS